MIYSATHGMNAFRTIRDGSAPALVILNGNTTNFSDGDCASTNVWALRFDDELLSGF